MLLGFVPCFPEGFKFRGSGHLLGPEEFGGPKRWYSYLKPFILYARWYDSFQPSNVHLILLTFAIAPVAVAGRRYFGRLDQSPH